MKVHLQRMMYVDPVRHCAGCSSMSKKEDEFFEKHVKNLIIGNTQLQLLCLTMFMFRVFVQTCRQSSNVLYYIVGNSSSLDTIILLESNLGLFIPCVASGAIFSVKDGCGEGSEDKGVYTCKLSTDHRYFNKYTIKYIKDTST